MISFSKIARAMFMIRPLGFLSSGLYITRHELPIVELTTKLVKIQGDHITIISPFFQIAGQHCRLWSPMMAKVTDAFFPQTY